MSTCAASASATTDASVTRLSDTTRESPSGARVPSAQNATVLPG
jgi:hypothetical protein